MGNAEYGDEKMQVIELMEAALVDDSHMLADEEREDVVETMDQNSPRPVLVSEIVLEEDTVYTETAVVEVSSELTLARQVETVAVVEDINIISSEGPTLSEETVVSELQETQSPESPSEVVPPKDTGFGEPTEAPEIQDVAEETTPEVASVVEITTASEASLEFLDAGEVALASLSENAAACEAPGQIKAAKLSETIVLNDDASTGEGEDVPLIEAQVEPLEQCKTIALSETGEQLFVASEGITSLEEHAAALAEAPVNWEALEHAEVSMLTEATPAPEEECEAADLDLQEEAPASLSPLQTSSSEEDLSPQAETINTESLAEIATEEDATAVESLSADLGTVSLFR